METTVRTRSELTDRGTWIAYGHEDIIISLFAMTSWTTRGTQRACTKPETKSKLKTPPNGSDANISQGMRSNLDRAVNRFRRRPRRLDSKHCLNPKSKEGYCNLPWVHLVENTRDRSPAGVPARFWVKRHQKSQRTHPRPKKLPAATQFAARGSDDVPPGSRAFLVATS